MRSFVCCLATAFAVLAQSAVATASVTADSYRQILECESVDPGLLVDIAVDVHRAGCTSLRCPLEGLCSCTDQGLEEEETDRPTFGGDPEEP